MKAIFFFSLISSNQCTYAEIADILPAKYAHDRFKDYTFAIGAGAEKFQNRIDNTEIPVKIAEAAGYTRK